MRILQASACVLALCLAAPAEAQQFQTSRPPGLEIGAEAGLAFTMGDFGKGLSSTGYDFTARLGYEFSIGFTPQVTISYGFWGTDPSSSNTIYNLEVMPGIRWSFLAGTIRPWGTFDIGLGHVSFPGNNADGLAYDVGGGADFMLTTGVGLGLHLRYNHTSFTINNVDFAAQWLDFGAGLVITF
jgi:outer membrane protein with beta-barrel domain